MVKEKAFPKAFFNALSRYERKRCARTNFTYSRKPKADCLKNHSVAPGTEFSNQRL